ncbi:glycosyltransferase family 1 protein [bacterium]|nr:glycosyltransferase family 1 protein [bacterium]
MSIFGDKGWSENLPGDFLHANVDYYTELQEVYNNSRINLNQTSFQMPTAVNQRVFDVPLSGGFLITDEQEDMNTLFNTGNDCVTYDCVDEIPELVKYFQNNSPIREKITKRAAEHILRHHTYFRRLETMVTKLKKEYKHNFAVPAEVGLN